MKKQCKSKKECNCSNKKGFYGKYYKIVSPTGYSLAFITYTIHGIKGIQLLDKEQSYQIKDLDSIKVYDSYIAFNIKQVDINITGNIYILNEKKPNKDIMGPFRCLPIECKHNIYTVNGNVNGELIINSKVINFDKAKLYVEGDEGTSFPSKYLWMNSISDNDSFTLSIADIPLFKGKKSIMGHFLIIDTESKEYIFATYNGSKIISISKSHIFIKKGKYLVVVDILEPEKVEKEGKPLLAPSSSGMDRVIKETISIRSRLTLRKKDKVIFQKEFIFTSVERVNL